jgi:hypothetical protein
MNEFFQMLKKDHAEVTGINDTTTAVMCVDYLAAILARFAVRRIAPSHRFYQGELRVLARSLRPDPVECRWQRRHYVADALRASNHRLSDSQSKPAAGNT